MKFTPRTKDPQDKSIRRHILKEIDRKWANKKPVHPAEAKSAALESKAKGYDASTSNPASYASHQKRLSDAYSSHREYLANKNK